jgi:homoserine dehydrogenase
MKNAPLRIGIAGLGTVGKGVLDILNKKSALLEARAGRPLIITAVSARSKAKKRGVSLKNIAWHEDALALASNPKVDVVAELIGGADGIALALCRTALENGKHVVTANKALIAKHGLMLAKLAEKKNVELLFEASVAGGIPVIKTLREGLAANNIRRIAGILNGTCNYILTAMELDGRPFAEVLKEAQDLGYAEADPGFDIDGVDASHKLAILSSLAFGVPVNVKAMHVEGIRRITLMDIRYALELGYRIRLLGIARMTKKGIEQRVHPALVPLSSPIAAVEGVLNAVEFDTDSLGSLFMEGAGAGGGPTASAVVADIVDIASGRGGLSFGMSAAALKPGVFTGIAEHEGPYYLHLKVTDKPGVLAGITKVLGGENIGVESVVQPPSREGKAASVILITHVTSESGMVKALKKIGKLEYVLEEPHIIRIENL